MDKSISLRTRLSVGSNPTKRTMTLRRNDSTPEGKAIWDMVERVAARAPQWIKDYIAEAELEQHFPAKEEIGGSNPLSDIAL